MDPAVACTCFRRSTSANRPPSRRVSPHDRVSDRSLLEAKTDQDFSLVVDQCAQPPVRSVPKRRREDFVYEPDEAMPRGVTHVVGSGSVRVLPDSAFQDSCSLEEVMFEEGVVEIRGMAFRACTSLKYTRFPSTLLRIGSNTFYGCTSLREIHLPEGITGIGPGACFYLSLHFAQRGDFSGWKSIH